jgi:hypothetical protein
VKNARMLAVKNVQKFADSVQMLAVKPAAAKRTKGRL